MKNEIKMLPPVLGSGLDKIMNMLDRALMIDVKKWNAVVEIDRARSRFTSRKHAERYIRRFGGYNRCIVRYNRPGDWRMLFDRDDKPIAVYYNLRGEL